MTIHRKFTRVFGAIFLITGAILVVLYALLWLAGSQSAGGLVGSILIVALGVMLRRHDPENSSAAKRKAANVQLREQARETEARKRTTSLRSWCPNEAITLLNSNQYALSPNTNQEDLAVCSNYVEKRIVLRERDLRSAERELERADRKANAHRARKSGSLIFSRYEANLADKKVKEIEDDIEKLHQLYAQIEDRLMAVTTRSQDQVNKNNNLIDAGRLEFCTSCGNSIKPNEYFCAGCGKELTRNI